MTKTRYIGEADAPSSADPVVTAYFKGRFAKLLGQGARRSAEELAAILATETAEWIAGFEQFLDENPEIDFADAAKVGVPH